MGGTVTMHCVENKMWRVIEVAKDLLLHTVAYVQVKQVIEKVDCGGAGFYASPAYITREKSALSLENQVMTF